MSLLPSKSSAACAHSTALSASSEKRLALGIPHVIVNSFWEIIKNNIQEMFLYAIQSIPAVIMSNLCLGEIESSSKNLFPT